MISLDGKLHICIIIYEFWLNFLSLSFICTVCGSALKRKEHLERHTVEHNPDYRPYMCDFCSKSFKRKHHLTSHQQLHNAQKKEVKMLYLHLISYVHIYISFFLLDLY